MLEIRWHSRAGQGAVTGAKGLGSIVAQSGKEVQACGQLNLHHLDRDLLLPVHARNDKLPTG